MRLTIGILFGALLATLAQPNRSVRAEPEAASWASIVARADPAIAHITTRLKDEGTRRSKDDGVGAGFHVGDGYVVTSRHVVSGAAQLVVTMPGAAPVLAKIVGVDEPTDTALLRMDDRGGPSIALGASARLRKGDRVFAVGSPFHLANSWSTGIVSGLHRSGVGVNPRGFERYIQTDAAANLGNSGGPLLNTQGQVVGVVSAILSRTGGSQGIALAVPIEAVMAAVDRLRGGRPARPSLGLSVRAQPQGLVVSRLDARGAAARAGLRVGDILVACNGAPLRVAADLQSAVWSLPAGTPARITIQRQGQRHTLTLRTR